jgi:electron transfer flavoprotein beta subunit
MKILVCVKQVPESEAPIEINDSTHWIQTDRATSYRMNRFDEFAVEEALLIQENFQGTTIDVISVGPDRSAIVVRRALGMGAGHGIHIITEHQGYLDPFIIASWIGAYARTKNYDLILTGVMAEDAMQGQVGPMIAETLSLPCATSCIFERLSPDTGTIYVEREIEGGYRDTLELKLPAVLTLQSGTNKPRYPSLSNILRAKKRDLETIDAGSFEQPTPRQDVSWVEFPRKSRSGVVFEGTQQEKAAQLLQILEKKSLIR